ncbi:MAG: DNA polymerase I [Coraliomargaritaceae bacterium]
MKTLYLLDGMALAYRAHFALINSPIHTSSGFNTSAIFGFTATLIDIINKRQPSHLAIVFDTSAPTERHRIHPEYKANREAMPEDLAAAMPHLDRVAQAFGIPVLKLDGYEADDIIGTLAHRAEKEDFQAIYMVTPDKDFGQLVTERIHMYRPGRKGNEVEILDVPAILEKWGIARVDQVIDMLGLCGDSVDNIPGVPGIGPKTAQKLLAQFDSVEGILDNTDQLKGKQQEKLRDHAEQARLSKTLATIQLDVPIQVDLDSLSLHPPEREKLQPLLDEFELRTLGKRIFGEEFSLQAQSPSGETFSLQSRSSAGEDSDAQIELLPAQNFKTLADTETNYRTADSAETLQTLVDELRSAGTFALDTETTALNPRSATLVGIAFSTRPHTGWWVPTSPEALQTLRPLLADPALNKIGHNLKFDLAVLTENDCPVHGNCWDTLLAHSLVDPSQRHNLDSLAENCLNYSPIRFDDLIPGQKKDSEIDYSNVDPQALADYAIEDADIALQLWQHLQPQIESNGLTRVFYEIETPLLPVLVHIERQGIALSTETLAQTGSELETHIETLRETVYQAAGRSFNLNSPKQLGEVLFDELKLVEKPKKTRTGQYATNEQVLTTLANHHPIVAQILEYRQLSKLKSTYVDALPNAVDPVTQRVHTHFGQAQTATGRLSSNDPNLQNIPVRSERGREIRKAFIPRPGWQLLAADYSQIELRILAALSQDPGLLEAFRTGQDIHTATAARLFSVPSEQVDRDQRSTAKMVNFGIPYGISAFGLAQRLGNVSRTEAQEIIDNYFAQFPGIPGYIQSRVEQARQKGYVETLCGRRRALPDIDSKNGSIRNAAERNAINMPIQGTAADMIKLAMIRIHQNLQEQQLQSRMLLQVHDELLFETAPGEEDTLRQILTRAMTEALPLDCPLEVTIGTGQNWLEAH